MRWVLAIILLNLSQAVAEPPARVDDGGPFADAVLVPDDATMYVHLRDAADLRRRLTGRPVQAWMGMLLADGELARVWIDLARQLGVSPDELVDEFLGRKVTLVKRPAAPAPTPGGVAVGEAPSDATGQWALITEMDEPRARRLQSRLRPRLRRPHAGIGIFEWPEHALLMAKLGERIVVGPIAQPAMFYDVVERLGGVPQATLASHPAVKRGRRLGDGRAAVLVRHALPMGGWSVVVGDLEGDRVRLRHAGRFEDSPIQRAVSRMCCEFTPLETLESRCMLTLMEPTDVGDGPLESFLVMLVGEPLVNEDMRQNVGDLRIIALGDEEGRQRENPVDVLAPTVAVCWKVKDAEAAESQLDERMVRLGAQVARVGSGGLPFDIEKPAPPARPMQRHVDVSAIGEWLPGGAPLMGNLTLNWTVVEGPSGPWSVIASHPDHLADVVQSIRTQPPSASRPVVGRFDSVGSADGIRVSRHLRSWADKAELLAEPEDVEDFRDVMHLLAEFAGGVERCRWRMARPCEEEMRLRVELDLAPARSAETAPEAP
jgi:hypothetical protein